MKNIQILVMMISMVICLGCEDYLDVKSNSQLSTPTTIEDLQAMLDYTNNMNISTPGYGEASADNYFLLDETYDSRGDRDRNAYIWVTPPAPPLAGGVFNTDYAKPYLAIYHANVALEQVEKIEKSSVNVTAWENVKGSALFFRSYYFLQLAWVYTNAYNEANASTDLGIILRLNSDFNIPSVRSSNEETYDQIIEDTRKAINLLQDHPQVATRPSKAAAYGLLARTYLSMNNYDSAFKYSNLSLSIKNDLIDYNSSDVDIGANVPFQILNQETVFFTRISTAYAGINPSLGRVDTMLYQSYNNEDLRKTAFFRPNGIYQRFKGSYAANTSQLFSGITTAEMLLTRAECYARLDFKDLALADLNTLMVKRWSNSVPYPVITAVDSEEALAKILVERRKELLFRGLRWMDIKRLNAEGANISLSRKIAGTVYTLPANDDRFALALPIDIIQETDVPQNPGW